MRIALLQLEPHGLDVEANLARGLGACREAAALGAHVALFPEMWSIGYAMPHPDDAAAMREWQSHAIAADSSVVEAFRDLARELRLAIAVTFLEAGPGRPYNTALLVDCRGEPALHYRKVHTCAFDREVLLEPGDVFPVATLETAAGAVEAGVMICFDREFPESARCLALAGAELILVPNACDLPDVRVHQVETRAFENMAALAVANYPGAPHFGRSVAFDGMAFAPGGGGPRDMRLVEAGPGATIALADLDLEALRAYRAREVWGAKHRRPAAYRGLA